MTANTTQISQQIEKSLKCLNDTEELMNNILSYCQKLYKQEPTAQSINTIQGYLLDNVNTVGEHIFGVSRRVDALFGAQMEELDHLQSEMTSINHRLTSAEGFISNAFMLKFRGLPRRPIPILVRSQKLTEDKLPRASRKRKAWTRSQTIDYTILDDIGLASGGRGARSSESMQPGSQPGSARHMSNDSRPSYMKYQSNKRSSTRQTNHTNSAPPPKLSQKPPALGAPPPMMSGPPPAVPSPAYNQPGARPPSNPMARPPSNPMARPPSNPMARPPSNPMSRPPSNPMSRGPPEHPGGGPPAPGGVNPNDPKWAPYKKMLKIGLPAQSVRNKMRQDGFDPAIVDSLM